VTDIQKEIRRHLVQRNDIKRNFDKENNMKIANLEREVNPTSKVD
jgi:hypothetical protein